MNTAYNRAVHQFAVFAAACTFVLLNAGALVTSNDAGLSIPDWPLAYGSFVPPFVGGIRYEYTHRVLATGVGILTIILAAWLFRVEKRSWMRWLGLAALGGVIAQGILGGLTVKTYQLPPVSAAHATLAQLFFSTLVAIAVFTSSWWFEAVPEVDDAATPPVRTLVPWMLAAVFVQLVLGAAFRHKGFGIIPHLIGAVVVTILVFMSAGALKRRFAAVPALRRCALYLHILIGLQLLLGAGAYWSRIYNARFPQPIAVMIALTVLHTVTGALVLALALVTTLISYRMLRPVQVVAEASPASEQVAH
jgi:cytochrome c oxidase assembly protein subunit 15